MSVIITGIAINKDVSTVCKIKISMKWGLSALSKTKSLILKLNCAFLQGVLLNDNTKKILVTVNNIINTNKPDNSKYLDNRGPIINALKKAVPIATPTIAMDIVLLFSAVLSDKRAMRAPEIAPAPCNARPIIR